MSKLDRSGRLQFVISGSNAHLLSGELATVLTGRHITVELFPFDLHEYRLARQHASLTDYLHEGGFPEPISSKDRDLLLRQYFIDIVQRDVRERVGARSSRTLRQVVQMVFESAGSELLAYAGLPRRAASRLKPCRPISKPCEQAYLLFSCPWFAFSERKRLHRNRKYYPVDTALRRVSGDRNRK